MAENEKKLSVPQISTMIEKEGLKWSAGDTELSALSPAEQKRYLGLVATAAEIKAAKAEVKKQAELEMQQFKAGPVFGAPVSKDWRNIGGQNYVKDAKNQGGCGSCVSFGTCGAIEANMRIKSGDANYSVDLSEAFMQFCGGGSCNGWGLTSGLAFAKSTGVTDEACFPYQPKNMPCTDRCSNWQSRLVKIQDFTGHSSMQARKDAIANIGPVVAGMAVYNDFFSYSSGIYQKTSGSTLAGYHCICVVGYDDSQQCWIVKNSWGPNWGDNGFCRIKYNQSDLLIDSSWAFYSVSVNVTPVKGNGPAKYLLVDKKFGTNPTLWAYVDSAWRYKVITDADLQGFVQELFDAQRVDIWYEKSAILLARPWKTL